MKGSSIHTIPLSVTAFSVLSSPSFSWLCESERPRKSLVSSEDIVPLSLSLCRFLVFLILIYLFFFDLDLQTPNSLSRSPTSSSITGKKEGLWGDVGTELKGGTFFLFFFLLSFLTFRGARDRTTPTAITF